MEVRVWRGLSWEGGRGDMQGRVCMGVMQVGSGHGVGSMPKEAIIAAMMESCEMHSTYPGEDG